MVSDIDNDAAARLAFKCHYCAPRPDPCRRRRRADASAPARSEELFTPNAPHIILALNGAEVSRARVRMKCLAPRMRARARAGVACTRVVLRPKARRQSTGQK